MIFSLGELICFQSVSGAFYLKKMAVPNEWNDQEMKFWFVKMMRLSVIRIAFSGLHCIHYRHPVNILNHYVHFSCIIDMHIGMDPL